MKTYLGAFAELDETDYSILEKFISEFATYFDYSNDGILKHEFIKLFPLLASTIWQALRLLREVTRYDRARNS